MSNSTEVRTISPTGTRKGQKIERMSLVPTGPLMKLAEHYGRGAEKYTERDVDGNVTRDGGDNWRSGASWRLFYDSMMRHAMQFWSGEDIDEEIGTPHLAAVAWHAFTLLEYMETHREFDDRPSTLAAKAEESESESGPEPSPATEQSTRPWFGMLFPVLSHANFKYVLRAKSGRILHHDGLQWTWGSTHRHDDNYGPIPVSTSPARLKFDAEHGPYMVIDEASRFSEGKTEA